MTARPTIPYMQKPFEIGFQISQATFKAKSHLQLKKIMLIKKVNELETLVVYPDLGLCQTKFEIVKGNLAMCGRIKIK